MIQNFEEIKLERGEVAHRVIAEHLRDKILKGDIAPGTEFPSTAQLAVRWNTSNSTAHIALKNLVKEGLLERRHGSGTYVRERPRKLKTVGIYFSSPNIWSQGQLAFYRSLQGFLEREITARGYEVVVFVDRRHERDQREALPSLASAVSRDEIQGLIIPMANSVNLVALLKLPVASSVITAAKDVSNKIGLNDKKFHVPVGYLNSKGCSTVGLISSVHTSRAHVGLASESEYFEEDFRKCLEQFRMTTKSCWIKLPELHQHNQTLYGYHAMKALYAEGELPNAIIVYPDMTARGVIMAALELGIPQKHKVRFVFHKSMGVEVYCPFAASWIISDTKSAATALIDQVEAQYRGEKVTPVPIPAQFRKHQTMLESEFEIEQL